jgi:hypothetical protein
MGGVSAVYAISNLVRVVYDQTTDHAVPSVAFIVRDVVIFEMTDSIRAN